MKFLCELCKTRYSIGDDRVRGKILKIRCKNCSNIITVREGMAAAIDEGAVYGGRTKPATTVSPLALEERASESVVAPLARGASPEPSRARPTAGRGTGPAAALAPSAARGASGAAPKSGVGDVGSGPTRRAPEARRSEPVAARGSDRGAEATERAERRAEPAPAPTSALNAAFASAMAKPPPALEEEWYVSIDGAQAGPFSLAEAQRWVGQKAFDADLHCWSEGFDDWLPVDKVSHFRGLRTRSAPPALPRAGARPPVAVPTPTSAAVESKPMFAATMASLERGASAAPSPSTASAPTQPPSTAPALATPARGVPSYRSPNNGLPGPVPAKPDPQPRPGAPQAGGGDGRATISTGSGATRRPAADLFERHEPADAPTQLLTGAAVMDPFAGRVDGGPATSSPPASGDASAAGGDADGELHIGEVSRVVNLGDLSRTPRTSAAPVRRAPTAAATRATGAATALRGTGAATALRSTSSVASLGGTAAPAPSPDGTPDAPGEPDAALAQPPEPRSHRRGLFALLGFALVLVLGVTTAVVLFVVGSDDLTGSKLGRVRDIDTSRPEDPITHRPLAPGVTPTPPANPFIPRPVQPPRPTNPVVPRDPEPVASGPSLRSEEIEEMARKHQDMTQRCYMRSQRGADAILVGDVKKIAVTLTIDRDGNVSNVGLSEHANNNLGKCLIGSMRSWKFRASAGGAFRFSLNFVSG